MKYLKKINSHPVTFIALVVVQAYGHHQSKKKYRKFGFHSKMDSEQLLCVQWELAKVD